MKLKIRKFESFARQHGYSSGGTLIRRLGGKKRTYSCLKRGLGVGYELVRSMYNMFGAGMVFEVIDFGAETLKGFESKFVKVGGMLF